MIKNKRELAAIILLSWVSGFVGGMSFIWLVR